MGVSLDACFGVDSGLEDAVMRNLKLNEHISQQQLHTPQGRALDVVNCLFGEIAYFLANVRDIVDGQRSAKQVCAQCKPRRIPSCNYGVFVEHGRPNLRLILWELL